MSFYHEETLKVIQQQIDVFTDHGRDKTVSETKIHNFLTATDVNSRLCRSDRLMLLAMGCADFGWEVMSQIYDYVVRTQPPEDQLPALIMWQATVLDHFMAEDNDLTVEERCRVAEDMHRILTHALEVSPNNAGLANSYGTLYLRHPLRKQNEPDYLHNAITWFRLAEEWSGRALDNAYIATFSLANAYFELQQWGDALRACNRHKELYIEIKGEELCSEIDTKIAECEQRLAS